ncbi:hypothetical protein IMSAGC014_02121 [Bacteroidaceae bacterium]|nr:hypothetical protein [Prevotella sp. MGM2]GAY29976.1 hypothetical protein PvtlMGM2_0829 [Prevotella sp. MGM2]GFI35600.1 hypothetical protein IMSAGC014_02121 [Bacteroidaceae bacterium]
MEIEFKFKNDYIVHYLKALYTTNEASVTIDMTLSAEKIIVNSVRP